MLVKDDIVWFLLGVFIESVSCSASFDSPRPDVLVNTSAVDVFALNRPGNLTTQSSLPESTTVDSFSNASPNLSLLVGETGCGGQRLLPPPSGVFYSRGFLQGDPYTNNLYCAWHLLGPVGHYIKLRFDAFSTEGNYDSRHCSDFVSIYDGASADAPLLGKFCGKLDGVKLKSSNPQIFVEFKTDSSKRMSGFKVSYQFVSSATIPEAFDVDLHLLRPVCARETVLTTPMGDISSPDYNPLAEASKYPNDLNCTWKILSSPGFLIHLIFHNFDLEGGITEVCPYDYLAVYNGRSTSAPLLKKLCGSSYPRNVTANSGAMYIVFFTDAHVSKRGFKLSYYIHNPRDLSQQLQRDYRPPHRLSGCGGQRLLTSLRGTIRSHDHNINRIYKKRSKCEWSIILPIPTNISLFFRQFSLEGSGSSCSFDQLRIYSGSMASPDRLKSRLCGNLTGTRLEFGYPQIFITFGTDDSVEYEGFIIEYHAVHAATRPPSPPQEQPQGDDLEIAPASTGTDSNPPHLSPADISSLSISPPVSLDGAPPNISHLTQRHIFSRCGGKRWISPGQLKTAAAAVSAGPPPSSHIRHFNYSNNVHCEWIISTAAAQFIKVDFISFKLEQSKDCRHDRLQIYDGTTTKAESIGRFCGDDLPPMVLSSQPQILIVFHTDHTITSEGFELNYSSIVKANFSSAASQCSPTGRTISAPHFNITSQNFGSSESYPPNSFCVWWFQAKYGQRLVMKFIHLSLEGNLESGCKYDNVTILETVDGTKSNLTQIGSYCGTTPPKSIISKSNLVKVSFRSDNTVNKAGFLLSVTFVDECNNITQYECFNGECIDQKFRCDSKFQCSDHSDEAGCRLNDESCGLPEIKPYFSRNKIVHGYRAKPHSWPWQIQITLKHTHYCGGALLDPWWVLTAAHCFLGNKGSNLAAYVISAGRHSKKDELGKITGETRRIRKVVMHPDHKPDSNDMDAALVLVDEPFSIKTTISHVCLPEDHVGRNHHCVATGWGKTFDKNKAGVLNQVLLPLNAGNQCQQLGITHNMFCAGDVDGGGDTCQGDSGGPLVCRRKDQRWYQQGITSWGIGCAAGTPGVYTKVPNIFNWVRRTMQLSGPQGLQPSDTKT